MAKGRKGRLILIDAHSLIYRAFFALPPMSTSDGRVTNAVYGFTSMLAIVLASRPEYAIAAFDLGKPTFRSQEYEQYKAGRRAMPEDLRPQIEMVRELLGALSIPIYGVEGFEADDVIGTLARIAEERGHSVTIVSGDLDCLQLVTESVEALVPRRGITDTFLYGPDQVRQRYGFEPPQLIDFKALRGDTSDNIPGVPGVGDKTAAKLVQDYVTVDALLERVDELPEGRLKTALQANADKVRLGKRMVTIVRDVPVELELERARWTRYDYDKARRVFDHLEFRQLLSRFPPPDQVPVQPSLALEPAPRAAGLTIVQDPAEAASLVDGSEDVGVFAFTEGTGRGCRILGLGVSMGGKTFYVTEPEAMDAVASTLSGRPISGHDAKETELALRSLGGGKRDWAFSTFLAAYLLGAGSRDPRLEDLAREFLAMELVSTEQLLGTGRAARKPSAVGENEAAEFAARRAEAILNLRPRLEAEMRNLGVDYLFHEIELPLAGVLADMESEGVAIDVSYLKEMQEELAGQLAAIETEVEEVAGQKFNLNAPQQLAKVLFEDLRLPVGKRTKTGYSTDADVLTELSLTHPLPGKVLEHRTLSKLKGTYADALPLMMNVATGRIHTTFNQLVAATGRLRRAFKAGRPDHVMVSADYAQIELRIAAHLSGDPMLLDAFKAGQDIHTATAAAVFKVPIEQVDPSQRRLAKIANFGSIYGQGEYGLSQQLGITGDVAREFLGQYWSTYSKLREFLDDLRRKAREEGLVVSATGRRRAIPDLRSPNFQLRSAAERMAINFPMQSLAADIIKIAMVRLQREIEADQIEGRMLLQVHDELLFEVPRAELDQFAEKVPRIMTGAYELETGIEVEMKVGPNWADMKKLAVVRA
ncbi:MAG: DNA polymerase I [Chloroflexi bacterium]|nr:MAG: DNA polymerase I [Chloroflexota bacterium]